MVNFDRMRKLIRDEEHMRWAIERQTSKATKITTTLSKTGGGHTNRVESKTENGAVALAVLKDEYQSIWYELEAQRKELRRLMTKIRNEEYRLEKLCLRMRYLKGVSVRIIAVTQNYSESYIFNVMKRAEEMVMKIQDKQNSSE